MQTFCRTLTFSCNLNYRQKFIFLLQLKPCNMFCCYVINSLMDHHTTLSFNAGNSVINTIKDPRFGDGSCHNLSALYELKVTDDPDYHVWQYKPTACLPN